MPEQSSELVLRIREEMKTAMKAKDKQRLGTIRLITAAIKQVEVDKRIELTDADTLQLLDKMLKQRRDSIAQYEQAGRDDLAEVERQEIEVIQEFMPQPLSEGEIDALIEDGMAQSGAQSMRDMGKVMGLIRPQVQGRADMAVVSQKIKAKLS